MPGIIKYQVCFTRLTKRLQEFNPIFYDRAIIQVRLQELQEEFSYMVKCNKAHSSGTKITFVPVRSVEEYKDKLREIIADGEKLGMEFSTADGKQVKHERDFI